MSVTEDSIRQVITATDIVRLVGTYVNLKKAGIGNWTGLCPFHPEKSPSFNVSESRQRFHCFGCGKGGDAVGFVREHLNLNFIESVRHLAQQAGIVLVEESRDPQAESRGKQRSRLISLHNDAAKWMHDLLIKFKGEQPDAARAYLTKRGLNGEVCRRWLIGYAPKMLNLWREWARSKGYKDNELVEAGLAANRQEGATGIYMRFSHRVMFPVRNEQGDVIAFSGRLLDPEQKGGKYINSPETPIFSKSHVFFGWDRSRRPISKADTAIVCEGQIDLITAVEHGVENLVAPLGTAVTEHHARMLRRAASQVVLCFDADNAGYNAAIKSFRILAPEGLLVKVVTLPKGEDPDSLIRQQGVAAFQAKLAEAKNFFDFQMDLSPATLDPNNVLERTKLIAALADNLLLISDKTAQDSYLGQCATRLNIPTSDIRTFMVREQKKQRKAEDLKKAATKRQSEISGSSPSPYVPNEAPGPSRRAPASSEELPETAGEHQITNLSLKQLIRLSLTNSEVFEWLNEQASGGEIPWRDLLGGDLLEKILCSELNPQDPASLSVFTNALPPASLSVVSALLIDRNIPTDGLKDATQALNTLRRDALTRRKVVLAEKLRRQGVTAEEFLQISQELARIKSLEKSIGEERLAGINLVPMEQKKPVEKPVEKPKEG